MSPAGRTALLLGGSIAVVGGTLGALYVTGHLPLGTKAPPAGTPLIVPWPQDAAQAQQALIQLDVLWWDYWANNNQQTNSPYQQQLNQEATAIRAAYPGSGPVGGYTCTQLKQMGKLPASFACPSYESGVVRARAAASRAVGGFMPAEFGGFMAA
jgi:hypothetical protein